jgi:hypothetical protein
MPVKQFLDAAHRVLSLPPQIIMQTVVGRVTRRCRDRARRQQDFRRPTYLKETPIDSQRLLRYLDGLSEVPRCFPTASLRELVGRYRRHCFNLLGSGWVEVRHGIECRGMEGYCYQMGTRVVADAEGRWLMSYINPANARESRRVWSLIQPGYTPIDWQRDFKSGFRWSERDWYKHIPFVHRGHKPGVDIKVPWELARMQHLPVLAYGYASALAGTTGFDDPGVYAHEFRNQILDFVATNPPRFGVNWACTMDVAIRVANWLMSYDLFHAFGAQFDADFDHEFMRTVYQHGRHIVSNLEWSAEAVGNHYLADIIGLLFVAAYLPRCAETDTWLAFSVQELVTEVERQFLPEGANFEASTSYHRLSAEMVVYATALVLALGQEKCRVLSTYDHTRHAAQPPLSPAPIRVYPRSGQHAAIPFPPSYFSRIGLMAQFTQDMTRPDGRITQIGDCDNGRFLKLHPAYDENDSTLEEDHLNHSHLVSAIGGLMGVSARNGHPGCEHVDAHVVERLAKGFRQDSAEDTKASHTSIISRGPDVERDVALGSSDLREGLQVVPYRQFGVFVYRSRRVNLAIRCGRGDVNRIGNHAHNDNLSFEFALDGTPVITDPGTYVYTPSITMRNRFRSTGMHNTLVLDGKEQNDWKEEREGLFQLQDRSNAKVIDCQATRFVGEHSGFGVPHRRELWITETGIHGRDQCEIEGQKQVMFHVAPSLRTSLSSDGTSVELSKESCIVSLHSLSGDWSLVDSFHSNGYGSIQPATVLSLRTVARTVEWTIQV